MFKLIWQLHFKDSLWSKWMINKYRSQINFWELQYNNNKSCTMKNMIKYRSTSLKCIKRVIVNGSNTLLWTDPWINCTSLVEILGWDRYYLREHKYVPVSHIIQEGHWITGSLIENRECGAIINQVPIQSGRSQDYWEWCRQ